MGSIVLKNSAYQRNRQRISSEPDEMEESGGCVSLPLLTIGEATRYLGVSRRILYQIIARGEITAVKSKGTTLIEKKSLDSFRASGKLT